MNHEMPDRGSDIRLAQSEVRGFRALEWKKQWCKEHGRLLAGTQVPDIRAAPEPSDEDLHWPEAMVSAYWDTGYLTMTVAEFQKLPEAQRNKILKLGGTK